MSVKVIKIQKRGMPGTGVSENEKNQIQADITALQNAAPSFSVISNGEVDTGAATDGRLISGERAKYIIDKAVGTSGVPTGGATGQVLAKASGTDRDTQWKSLAHSHDLTSGSRPIVRTANGTDISGTHILATVNWAVPTGGAFLLAICSVRGYGSNGYTGNGRMSLEFNIGSGWTEFSDCYTAAQLDQGVDSTVSVMAISGLGANGQIRAKWVTTSGYVTFTSGQLAVFGLPSNPAMT